jgi:hypothetical protein
VPVQKWRLGTQLTGTGAYLYEYRSTIRKQKISELNFFEVETVRTENFDIPKAIISTTSLYYSVNINSHYSYSSFNSQNPSQSDFENLYHKLIYL